jgi:nicotinate-nucleotide pyrophosphorylase (carboxylating)
VGRRGRHTAQATVAVKGAGVIAGLVAFGEVYDQLGDVVVRPLVDDGARVTSGVVVVELSGSARVILTGERTALNLLGRLSGIATLTRRFVDAVEGTGVRITDTRKTTPLWRELERMATRVGGAVNHRLGLDDMVLVKENHLACAGGVEEATRRIRAANRGGLEVEVETTNIEEVEAALTAGVQRIMLDNMSREQMVDAVRLIHTTSPRPEIEASGGITLRNVREVAETGVDLISVGALTHSAPALDLSLRVGVTGR